MQLAFDAGNLDEENWKGRKAFCIVFVIFPSLFRLPVFIYSCKQFVLSSQEKPLSRVQWAFDDNNCVYVRTSQTAVFNARE